jgi:hypothetical protein
LKKLRLNGFYASARFIISMDFENTVTKLPFLGWPADKRRPNDASRSE